jgi:hypothetical protein
MELQSTPTKTIDTPNSNLARYDFDVQKFNNLIDQKGLYLRHEKTLHCPCRREINGGALSSCVNCFGTGFLYFDKGRIRGAVQAINQQKGYKQYNSENIGISKLTALANDRIGFFDRLVLEDGESIHYENVFPKILTISGSEVLSALLTYEPKEIEYFYLFDGEENPYISLTASDYTISGRRITFSESLKDAMDSTEDGKYYMSIRYVHNPAFFVIEVYNDIRNTRVIKGSGEELKKFPTHALIKRAHMVNKEE